jgi:uncharacterized membrane protein HdeD (DUF308 family)
MNSDKQLQPIGRGSNWSIPLGIVLILIGTFAITLPLSTGWKITIWLGIIFSIAGVTELIYAWKSDNEDRFTFILKVAIGLLYLGAGIILLFNPIKGLTALTIILGSFLLFEGIFEVFLSLKLRPFSPNWGWILAHGILTLSLAVMIGAKWPSSSIWFIGLLIGISIISNGISRIMVSLVVRSLPSVQP